MFSQLKRRFSGEKVITKNIAEEQASIRVSRSLILQIGLFLAFPGFYAPLIIERYRY